MIYSYGILFNGYSCKVIYDERGNVLTYENSGGHKWEKTYDENNNVLTFKDSKGYTWEKTYDINDNELTHEDSEGNIRGFDAPELTMEQLVKKVGNFKLIK